MKKLTFLIAVLTLLLTSSCEKIKDATAIDIETELQASIPVSSDAVVAINLKSVKVADGLYSFNGNTSFSLADNPDLDEYIDNIRDMAAEPGALIQFLNAMAGNEILTCNLNYAVQPSTSMTTAFSIPQALSASNGMIEYVINSGLSQFISQIEANKNKTFSIAVAGTANYDVETTVRFNVPVIVSASPL